jgi:peptidyl-prolyl cis-trans isomerase B (cyclophilin B)
MVRHTGRRWVLAGLVFSVGAFGCGGGSKPGDAAQPTVSIPGPAGDAATANGSSFADAVLTDTDDGDQLPPPDRTLNGLSTGKLRGDVQQLWDEIAFTTPAGKAVAFTAVLDTEFGTVTLGLLPDVAPNHVRNFVALARAGYYDGLVFEHVIEQEGDEPESRLTLIEGGCPLGTGELGVGHLGYWLRPEFSDTIKHEEGTVGACRGERPDTAACRFYITLTKAPVMDGNFTVFARVTHGLDVVRTIARQPRPEGALRPNQPAVIRKVTIRTREVDKE